jgi:hypothetical protein
MRFQRHSSPLAYPARRYQYRMLSLVGLLAMVMVLYKTAQRPESWQWFAEVTGDAPTGGDAAAQSFTDASGKEIAIKRIQPLEPLPEGEYYASVSEAPVEGTAVSPSGTSTVTTEVQSLDPDLLTGLVDDWFGQTREEQPALARVMRSLQDVDAASLARTADAQVTFDVMLSDPNYYRGRLVSVSGRLKRLEAGSVGTGDDAVPIWEAWVIPNDSRGVPYLALLARDPAGVPHGTDIDEAVTVRGYPLRRYAYATAGGEAVTLMLAAPDLEWKPQQVISTARAKQEMQWTTIIGFSVAALGMGGLLVWYWLSDRRFRRSKLFTIAEARHTSSANELATLGNLDGGDPHIIRIEEPEEEESELQARS